MFLSDFRDNENERQLLGLYSEREEFESPKYQRRDLMEKISNSLNEVVLLLRKEREVGDVDRKAGEDL